MFIFSFDVWGRVLLRIVVKKSQKTYETLNKDTLVPEIVVVVIVYSSSLVDRWAVDSLDKVDNPHPS